MRKDQKIHKNEWVDTSPTTTISITGEVAPGALGGLSFEELTGQEPLIKHPERWGTEDK
ncbi:hypothetical protein P6P90_01740 [Ectobacillus antri]|jgi:hypothetical protein|uniref:Paeninodin family lasso peptide n=1 Tax=Ectobacillus antri TaxID=2486280 RepID=A0ABT6H183_9BACI|nr:hypothetical protein [Ectobacillus antri]MDG4656047.1 hypothetical protein [Ectobacillus antri]MDG5752722.1 hypothetical protein [Ectobacillus antri]